MKQSLRRERTLFLLFLGGCFVALMAALPIVTAQQTPKTSQAQQKEKDMQKPSAAGGSSAASPAASDAPDFDQADRNKDGFVDKSEAGVVPGLSANFERADSSRDGKLDREEYAKGLQILQVRR
ncbi:MAG TPA: hypothetical protein VGX52_15105 [Burkholderiales bacterium]|nr:hypothetical protein [Burkholderiales bacterium]